jgi:hypothetical protein
MGMMALAFSISVTCVVSGRTANLDSEGGPQVAMNLIAFEAEHLSDVVQSDAVGIAVYEKKRRLGGLESVGSEIVWLQLHRDDALDEVRKLVGRRTELFVFGLDREPLKVSAVSFGNASSASWTKPSRRKKAEIQTTLRTLSGWQMATCIATPPPML